MGELKTLSQTAKIVGISRPTLLKIIKREGIQVKDDRQDYRVKLLDEGQITQIKEIVERVKNHRTE